LEKKVLERLVHTSGDFSVQNLLDFSEGACEKGLVALKNGAPILTDTDMAAAAIKTMAENTTGNKVFTARMWFEKNNHKNLTKTAYGLSEGWKELSAKNSGNKSPIVVIGSSPTALTNLINILENAKVSPSLIIGMPVGFIGVEKSKNKLISTDLPRIVLNSTRGGAAMAAAAVNALLRETI
jgi:precorrin-8X/cobalt-precorrin-8 methylmutase